jgi:prepilin-type N-terminal cleavage/methylation domain-containing protein
MKNITNKSGFSLVETLVAITILLLVIVGPLSISSTSVKSTMFSSEQVMAFFLAQEGLEISQNARDNLILQNFRGNNPDPWSDFRNTNGTFRWCYAVNGCGLSLRTNSIGSLGQVQSCSNANNCIITLDTGNGVNRSKYGHQNGATQTPYTRVIRMRRIGSNEVSVTSTVTWQSGFSKEIQQVVVQTSLFNVYDNN